MTPVPCVAAPNCNMHLQLAGLFGKSQRVKTQRVKTSENFAEEKMFAEDISEDFSDITFTGF